MAGTSPAMTKQKLIPAPKTALTFPASGWMRSAVDAIRTPPGRCRVGIAVERREAQGPTSLGPRAP